MKRRTNKMTPKLIALVLIPIISLSLVGIAHSLWSESLYIEGTVNMGYWKACIRIRKTLEGAFTDPETGVDLTTPTDFIAIAASFPTKFKLTITVENCGLTTLTDVIVTDTIKTNVANVDWTASEGTVFWYDHHPGGKPGDFIFNDLTWTIETLAPGESASLMIDIETLRNPQDKYEPTSGDEGDSQDLEINEGATVTAETSLATLSATTGGITLQIVDDNTPENNIGSIATNLPYSTAWAEDRYP